MQPILFFGRRTSDQLFTIWLHFYTDKGKKGIKNEVNQTELTVMGCRDFDTGVNTR